MHFQVIYQVGKNECLWRRLHQVPGVSCTVITGYGYTHYACKTQLAMYLNMYVKITKLYNYFLLDAEVWKELERSEEWS